MYGMIWTINDRNRSYKTNSFIMKEFRQEGTVAEHKKKYHKTEL